MEPSLGSAASASVSADPRAKPVAIARRPSPVAPSPALSTRHGPSQATNATIHPTPPSITSLTLAPARFKSSLPSLSLASNYGSSAVGGRAERGEGTSPYVLGMGSARTEERRLRWPSPSARAEGARVEWGGVGAAGYEVRGRGPLEADGAVDQGSELGVQVLCEQGHLLGGCQEGGKTREILSLVVVSQGGSRLELVSGGMISGGVGAPVCIAEPEASENVG